MGMMAKSVLKIVFASVNELEVGSSLKTGLLSKAWLRVMGQWKDAVHHVWQVTEGMQLTGASSSLVLTAFFFFFYS